MTIINDLKWRYATKKFDSSKFLTAEQLLTLKEAFNLTAVSYGLQTLKLVVVKNKDLQKRVVNCCFSQQQVYDASHLLVICIQRTINKDDVDNYYKNIKIVRHTPDDILEPFKLQLQKSITQMSEADKETWATKQAYIALGNLMTVCAVEKIDCCPMEGFIPQQVDELLQLENLGLQSVLLLPVGFRATDDMFSSLKKVRKPLIETIIDIN